MTIYTILERLEKLEKQMDTEQPVLSFKERLEVLENQISEIFNIIGMK